MWILIAIGIVVLAHTAPAPFLMDAFAGRRSVWHMPKSDPPTIYFTYDDGPNPTTTPSLLDVLTRERVQATFFSSTATSTIGRRRLSHACLPKATPSLCIRTREPT